MYIRMGWTLTGTCVGCKNRGLNNIAIIVIAYIPSIVYHLKILKGKHGEIMKAILATR